mmetsp:Transcript_85498/g.227997  ORF Transcript_85498/g.227997 Transcript_85498/m.227997 type:complete len:96 (+) Transcript_85498:77-364(+)
MTRIPCRVFLFLMCKKLASYNLPFSRFDTKASGNWYKADEPWGAFLQTDGNPAVSIHPYENDASSGSFNPQAQTTWVPVDWGSWPNYNVHGYGIY